METTNSQRDDLDSLCQIWSLGTPVERILACLNNPAEKLFKLNGDELIANYEPLGVANQLARWTSNTWDARMSNPKYKGRSEPQKQASMDNRDVQITSVLSHLARLRNKNATPPLIVMKAIRMFYKGISHSVTQGNQGLLPDLTESGKPCTGAAYDYLNEQVDLVTLL